MWNSLKSFFIGNFGLKLVSLLLSIVLWVVVLGSRTVEVTKEVPVEIITGSDFVPVNDLPDRVSYKLAGPKAFLRTILDRKEKPIQINLASQKAGLMTYRFFADHIRVPLGVKVVNIEPPVLPIRLEPVKKKEVPVRVSLLGELPPGYKLVKTTIAPQTIKVKGPEFRLASLTELDAKPIDISGLQETTVKELQIEFRSYSYVRTDDPAPKIKIEIEAPNQMFRIRSLSVNPITDGRSVRLKDPVVTVYVRAASEAMQSLDRSEVKVTVDVKGKTRGTYRLKPEVLLPADMIFIKTVPSEITVEVK